MSVAADVQYLQFLCNLQGKLAMTVSVQDIKDAIANEAAEVAGRVNALEQQVIDLQAQLAGGTVVSDADLQAILEGVQGIITPAA